jgi:serine/threonine protein kinase
MHSRGGYGRVYRGVQEATGLLCAIKQMWVDEIFEREIRLVTLLRGHVRLSGVSTNLKPNILKLLGYSGSLDSLGFLVFDLCDGTLQGLTIADLDEKAVSKFARDILLALDHIHKHGCIHRDLKLEVTALHCFPAHCVELPLEGWKCHRWGLWFRQGMCTDYDECRRHIGVRNQN